MKNPFIRIIDKFRKDKTPKQVIKTEPAVEQLALKKSDRIIEVKNITKSDERRCAL